MQRDAYILEVLKKGVSRRSFLKTGLMGSAAFFGFSALEPFVKKAMAESAKPKKGGVFTVGYLMTPRSLDPHFETWPATLQIVHQTNNCLVKFDTEGKNILPDLAEKWEQNDELTYTFHLHKGVKFQNIPPVNGRELTSEDVKYSIERQTTNQPGRYQHAYFFLDKLDKILTPDKYTVVFKTKEPYAPFMNYMANPWTVIVAKELVEKHEDLRQVAVGTGPFILKEFTPNVQTVLVRNPDYFKPGLPYVDECRIQYIRDLSTLAAAVRGGQVDVGQIMNIPDVEQIKAERPDINLIEVMGFFPLVMRIQPWDDKRPLKPPFDKVEVRKAIAHATNKEEYIKITRIGYGQPMVGPIPPHRKPWALPESDNPKYDPELAKSLLAKAGYPNGFEVELICMNDAQAPPTAQVAKDQLGRVGIKANLKVMESAQYYNKVYSYNYEMSVHYMLSGEEPEESLRPYFGSTATYYRWNNKEIHRLIDEQAKILDKQKRIEAIHQIQRMVIDDAPQTFLYNGIFHVAAQPWVKGYVPPLSGYDMRVENIWIDKT